jgi:hypothetical protein
MSDLNSIPIVCPSCGYRRQLEDAAPAWQCPSCGIAYAKAQAATGGGNEPAERLRMRRAPDRPGLALLQKALTVLLVCSIALAGLSWWEKSRFADYQTIDGDLLQQPRQTATAREAFSFSYRGKSYAVQPVADYEIWGLVVSHNDIGSIADIYHDETSVDTKDLCIIWGRNLQSDDFQKVEYTSGSFTCYYSYGPGVEISSDQLSNNHLVTDDDRLRRIIDGVRIGDQVHVRGMLVNYGETGTDPRYWRKSSTTRSDTGNRACEVVFVDDIDVLARGRAGWYKAYSLALPLIPLLILLKAVIFFLETPAPRKRH